MTYETVAVYTQVLSLFFFMGMFLVVVAYVLWPKNRDKLDSAAKVALDLDAGTRTSGGRK